MPAYSPNHPSGKTRPAQSLVNHQPFGTSLSIAIVSKLVGAAPSVGDNTIGGQLLDARGHGSRAREALETHQVNGQANNVRGGHGSTRDGVGGSVGANPGGKDILTGSEDVDNGAIVGEGGAGVAPVDRGNSQSVRSGSRACIRGISLAQHVSPTTLAMLICKFSKTGDTYVLVSSSDDRKDTFIESVLNSVVEGIGVTTACHYPSAAVPFKSSQTSKTVRSILPRLMLIAAFVVRPLLTMSLAAQLKPSRMIEVLEDSPWKTLTDRRLVFLATP